MLSLFKKQNRNISSKAETAKSKEEEIKKQTEELLTLDDKALLVLILQEMREINKKLNALNRIDSNLDYIYINHFI